MKKTALNSITISGKSRWCIWLQQRQNGEGFKEYRATGGRGKYDEAQVDEYAITGTKERKKDGYSWTENSEVNLTIWHTQDFFAILEVKGARLELADLTKGSELLKETAEWIGDATADSPESMTLHKAGETAEVTVLRNGVLTVNDTELINGFQRTYEISTDILP